MAMKTRKCGRATVSYDARCSWTCFCSARGGCTWAVDCPDGHGGTISTTGTGIVISEDSPTHVGYDGTAEVIAAALERITGIHIIVPEEQRQTRVTGEVDGDVVAVRPRRTITLCFTGVGKADRRQSYSSIPRGIRAGGSAPRPALCRLP